MTIPAKYDTATPYLASHVILRKGDSIAMVLRQNTDWMNDHWGLLAGKVEKGESFAAAAIREAKEEGGVTIGLENLSHLLTAQIKEEADGWVAAVFESTIWEGEAYNAEPHVHAELKWFDIHDIPENTVPNVKKYLEAINEGKQYIEIGWNA